MNSQFDDQYIRLMESTKQRLDSSCWDGYTNEAYLTEKVTELTDEHLDEIRQEFYPDAGDAKWNMAVRPALEFSFEHDLMSNSDEFHRLDHNVDPTEEMSPNQFKKLADHLLKLKRGSIGSSTNRTTSWFKNVTKKAGEMISRTGKKGRKLGNKYKLRNPITKR